MVYAGRLGRTLAVLMVWILVSGCEVVGEMRRETVRLVPRDEKSLRVSLDMGLGEMEVKGSKEEILKARFAYNLASWQPHVHYQVRGDRGILHVGHMEEDHGIPLGEFENKWTLALNEKLPLDLRVDLAVGSADLEVHNLNLNRLNVNVGIGELRINLAQAWKHDVRVSIDIGIGELHVELPKSMGVRVSADRGIAGMHAPGFTRQDDGRFINANRGRAEFTLDLHVDIGIGEIHIREKEEVVEEEPEITMR